MALASRSTQRRIFTCGAFLAAASAPARPQQATRPPAPAQREANADSIIISVLTMGPGEEIFARFGHISLRVHNVRTGVDTAYNWGMFSFEQPRFLQRFLTGDTQYWMQGYPTALLVEAYRSHGRWVTEQELALAAPLADSLWRFIQWNAREEHKWYRYDYYRDNCSTRVRDALDMVLGGALKRGVAAREHGVSFREETLRLGAAFPVLNLGMDFALGRPADGVMSAWEEMFVPMRLMDLLRDVRIRGADGSSAKLVRVERRLVLDDRYAEEPVTPDLVPPAFIVGLTLAGALLAMSAFARRSGMARWGIAVVGAGWSLTIGLAGLLVLCLGLFTRHVFMAQNANLLLATPASLALAVLIPLAVSRRSGRTARAARALAIFAGVGALAAVALRTAPGLAQDNRALLALCVPVHAALAFAVWRAASRPPGGAA